MLIAVLDGLYLLFCKQFPHEETTVFITFAKFNSCVCLGIPNESNYEGLKQPSISVSGDDGFMPSVAKASISNKHKLYKQDVSNRSYWPIYIMY